MKDIEEAKLEKKAFINDFQKEEKLLAGIVYELGSILMIKKKGKANQANLLDNVAEERHKRIKSDRDNVISPEIPKLIPKKK